MEIAAVVLCGGESRRMGRSKLALPFGPETLLERVVRLTSDVARPVVVVAADGQALPRLPDAVAVVRDASVGKGPVQGLSDGLSALGPEVEFAYATAVDAPFLAPAWIETLAAWIGDGDLALPVLEGRGQPLSALYRVAPAVVALGRMLARDELRLVGVAERLDTRFVPSDALRAVDPDLSTLHNLNTPADYERAVHGAALRASATGERAADGGSGGLRKIIDYF